MSIGCCTSSVFPPQKPERRAVERDEQAIRHWIEHDWPRIKRLAHRWRGHLVFIDETGYLLTPLMRRSWSLRGQTPVQPVRMKNRRRVSAIGAITISPVRRRVHRYVQLHRDRSIRQAEVIAFLRDLRRHLRGRMVVVWDNLGAHRGKEVRPYLARHRKTLRVEYLPPYAPELNPLEYSWSHDKGGDELANCCPRDVDDLYDRVRCAITDTNGAQPLLKGFIRHTGLPLRL